MTRRASAAERQHALELHSLQRAVLGVLANASKSVTAAVRTAVLIEALTAAVLTSGTRCPRRQTNRDSGVPDPYGRVELADACRRHAYRIDVDL